jgi:glycosyltransferase involved in cell wall biosynthesis
MTDPVTFVTEPLLDPEFIQYSNRIDLLERLAQRFDVAVAAPLLSSSVERALEAKGIQPINGGGHFLRPRHERDEIPSYIVSWTKDSFFRSNYRRVREALRTRPGLVVNLSMTTAYPCDLWYVQSGPLGLDAMKRGVDRTLKVAFTLAAPPVGLVDWHHLRRCGALASRVYSSTHWVGAWYSARGVPVRGVLPIYYNSSFGPSTRQPSRDYVLGYLGKETDSTALQMLIDSGIPLKLFGSKSASFVRRLVSGTLPPNVQVLGRLTEAELRDLYTNALFTVFPFTDEPFGLVPIESMACGTPVLTYAEQGPLETVVHGRTGWLVHSPEEMLEAAVQIVSARYPAWMPEACLERAKMYNVERVADAWTDLIRSNLAHRTDEPASILPVEDVRRFVPPAGSWASYPGSTAPSSHWTEIWGTVRPSPDRPLGIAAAPTPELSFSRSGASRTVPGPFSGPPTASNVEREPIMELGYDLDTPMAARREVNGDLIPAPEGFAAAGDVLPEPPSAVAYLPYLLHRSPRSHDVSDAIGEPDLSSEPIEVDLQLDPGRSPEQARVPAPPPPEVSIILATLNEAKNIPILLHEIETTFPVSHEVIVVDDGSTDGTREFLDGWAETHPNLRRIYNPGKQTTLRAHYQALREASGRYAIVMDSDLQHPTATIGQIYSRLKLGFDVVVASRYCRGGSTGNRRPFRGLVSRGAAELARFTVRPSKDLTDPMSGYFGILRSRIPKVRSVHRGYKILLLLLATNPELRMTEVPYIFREREEGGSKVVQNFRFLGVYGQELLADHRMRRARRIYWEEPEARSTDRGVEDLS